MPQMVRVKAPSTTSNLGPGFDVCGLALDALYDEVEISLSKEDGIVIEVEGEGAETISTRPEENTAGRTALEFGQRYDLPGIEIRLLKGIPPGRGLASSGVDASATALALDGLLDLHLTKEKLVEISMVGEQVASGTPHADDIAPSIYGGMTIVQSYNPLRIISIPPPKNVLFALAIPLTLTKSTRDLRAALPSTVALKAAIGNVGGVAALVVGMITSNPRLIGQGMMSDKIVEPSRIARFPVLENVRNAALETGACGATISGAGPTMIAVVDPTVVEAEVVARAMSREFENAGIEARRCVAKATGPARVLHTEASERIV